MAQVMTNASTALIALSSIHQGNSPPRSPATMRLAANAAPRA
jgi:hypothetical protein